MFIDKQHANAATHAAWDANAAYWDAHMGDAGNAFVNQLIWPAAQHLLDLRSGERVLDVGCGNGLYARRLAALGSEVVAFDFSAEMIERARRYEGPAEAPITYHVLDATDEAALLGLGVGSFDAALSCMALMDMADRAAVSGLGATTATGWTLCLRRQPSLFQPGKGNSHGRSRRHGP